MENWSLPDIERTEAVNRLALNIASLAFAAGFTITDGEATELAERAEKKAYTVALVESRTTTGTRPHAETFRAYTRKLGSLAVDSVKEFMDKHKAEQVGAVPSIADVAVPSERGLLDLTGDREFLVEETARAHLSPLFEDGAVQWKGGRRDEALEALRIISGALAQAKLRHLDVSDNALGEKGIRALAAAISQQSLRLFGRLQEALEKLAFQNVGCSVHACIAVEELVKNTDQLRILHLYNNMSGDEGATAIAKVLARSPLMGDFKLASSRVGPEGGIAIFKALSQIHSLERLDLSDNPLTPEVAEDLAAAVKAQTCLKELNLNDTSLGDEGVIVLAEALPSAASSLEVLRLALNEIGPDGAKALAQALPSLTHLRTLIIRENELGDEGASWIAKGIAALQNIEVLDFCQNEIMRPGSVGIAEVASLKEKLTLLALDENCISEAGVKQLKDILKKVGKLDALGPLDENDPESTDYEEEVGEGEDEAGLEDDGGLADKLASTHIA